MWSSITLVFRYKRFYVTHRQNILKVWINWAVFLCVISARWKWYESVPGCGVVIYSFPSCSQYSCNCGLCYSRTYSLYSKVTFHIISLVICIKIGKFQLDIFHTCVRYESFLISYSCINFLLWNVRLHKIVRLFYHHDQQHHHHNYQFSGILII